MGAGKTTIGTRVAAALGRSFVDNDVALERNRGSSASELAAHEGVEALHRAEAAVLLDALQQPDAAVIAAAASTITDPDVRRALARRRMGRVAPRRCRVAVARLPGSEARPFLDENPAHLVAEQSRERDRLFAGAADETVDTSRAAVDDVVAKVVASADERGLGV